MSIPHRFYDIRKKTFFAEPIQLCIFNELRGAIFDSKHELVTMIDDYMEALFVGALRAHVKKLYGEGSDLEDKMDVALLSKIKDDIAQAIIDKASHLELTLFDDKAENQDEVTDKVLHELMMEKCEKIEATNIRVYDKPVPFGCIHVYEADILVTYDGDVWSITVDDGNVVRGRAVQVNGKPFSSYRGVRSSQAISVLTAMRAVAHIQVNDYHIIQKTLAKRKKHTKNKLSNLNKKD